MGISEVTQLILLILSDFYQSYKDPLDSIPQFRAQKELKLPSYDSSNTRREEDNNKEARNKSSFAGDVALAAIICFGMVYDIFNLTKTKSKDVIESRLFVDFAGIELLRHFWYGNVEDFIIDNESSWNNYINSSTRVKKNIEDMLEEAKYGGNNCTGFFMGGGYKINNIERNNDYYICFESEGSMAIARTGFYTSGYSLINLVDFNLYACSDNEDGLNYVIYQLTLIDRFDFNDDGNGDRNFREAVEFYNRLSPSIDMQEFDIQIGVFSAFTY